MTTMRMTLYSRGLTKKVRASSLMMIRTVIWRLLLEMIKRVKKRVT